MRLFDIDPCYVFHVANAYEESTGSANSIVLQAVRYPELWRDSGGFDVDGVWRGKYVSLEKLRSAAKGGLGFCDVVFGWDVADELYDNARVTGWHTGYPDAKAVVDVSTARVIPWEPDTAALVLDFVNEDGSPAFGVVGIEEPLPKERLAELYADHQDYVDRFNRRVDGLVAEGWLLAEDADAMRKEAEQAAVP